MPAPSAAKIVLEVNLCRGTALLTKRAPSGGYLQAPCPGCLACDPETVAAATPVKTDANPFARLPGAGRGDLDEEPW